MKAFNCSMTNERVITNSVKADSKEFVYEEIEVLCSELVEKIIGSLNRMPLSVRYLLKLIEMQAKAEVCAILILDT